MQHPDVAVFHEQLADCFYFGADRRTWEGPDQAAIEASLLKRDTTYVDQLQEICDGMVGDGGKSFAFSKELSIYYQARSLPMAAMAAFRHCFLIRRPDKVARSFLKVAEKNGASTYFDPDELGFVELAELHRVVTSELSQPAIVVDADDLLAAPEAVLSAWCAQVDLPFHSCMLSWGASEPRAWGKWPGWHTDAAKSTGFARPARETETGSVEAPLPDEVLRAVEQCQPIYEQLHAMRIVPAQCA